MVYHDYIINLGFIPPSHTHTPPHQPCLSSHIECSDTSAVCCYLYFPEPCFSIIDPHHPIGKATNEQTAPETQAQARCTTGVGERTGKVTLSYCRLFPDLPPFFALCIHNNTWKWKNTLPLSASMYHCERKQKNIINGRGLGQGYYML